MPKLMAASALTSSNQSNPVLLASLDDTSEITTLHGFCKLNKKPCFCNLFFGGPNQLSMSAVTSPDNLKVILPLASVGLVLLMIFMTALYFTLWRCFNKMHLKSTEMSNLTCSLQVGLLQESFNLFLFLCSQLLVE